MHSIRDIVEKIKAFTKSKVSRIRIIPDDLFLGLILILVGFGSFGLGRLSKIEGSKTPIRIENAVLSENSTKNVFPSATNPTRETNQSASVLGATGDQLVGSKNGTKYYYPWCTGVQKISPANLIYFASKTEAETRGYTPSATCKGL